MAHKWIHLFMFSVPKVPDRWINPLFLLASFTWSPHLLELEWRAIHSEKSINSQLLDCWLSTRLAWVLPLRARALTRLCCIPSCPLWACGWGRKAHQLLQWLLCLSQSPQLGGMWEPRSWASLPGGRGYPCGPVRGGRASISLGPTVGAWSGPQSPCLHWSITSWLLWASRTCYSLYFCRLSKTSANGLLSLG